LSKGHGCLAQYVNLHKHGFVSDEDVSQFCKPGGILGEHPDRTKVPGVEASTGSLGHGLSFLVGISMAMRLSGNQSSRCFAVLGDGECHEGTIWEAAHVAANKQLGNLCIVVDWNESGMQLLPQEDMVAKWSAFGWEVYLIDGHSFIDLESVFSTIKFSATGKPKCIVARTVKGKGVSFIEGHGKWHHRIPDSNEYTQIIEALS